MKNLCKAFVFCGVLLALYGVLDNVFRWKDYEWQIWPNNATVSGFYDMRPHSVDVLFFGSSQGVRAFNVQQLYDDFGFCSYNLSTEQQSIFLSYYLLQEALKTQNPAVVVLDVWMAFGNRGPVNMAEGCIRKVVDQMKPSSVKRHLVHELCAAEPSYKAYTFYFRPAKYHERWKSLTQNDFCFFDLKNHSSLKGFMPESRHASNAELFPLEEDESAEYASMIPLQQEYLQKVVNLCAERGIQLILVKTPHLLWNVAQHNALKSFADSNGVQFLDYNERSLYEAVGYDYAKNGDSHLDISGAEKITNAIGEELLFLGLPMHSDEQFERSRHNSKQAELAMQLPHITDFTEYLDSAAKVDGTVFIAVNESGFTRLTSRQQNALGELGLDIGSGTGSKSFCAVCTRGKVQLQISDQKCWFSGAICNGRVPYAVESGGKSGGKMASIKVLGREHTKKRRGIHIAVYSNFLHRVVDTVCFVPAEGYRAWR